MNKILILTTKGCEACNIARHNITAAIVQCDSIDNIEVETKDWHDEKRDFIAAHKVKDFPTVFYMLDERVVSKSVGTYPIPVYIRWIDMYFKK